MRTQRLPQKPCDLWRRYHSAIMGKKYRDALATATFAVEYYTELGDLRHAGIWQRVVTNVHYLSGKYRKATDAAEQAVMIQPDRYELALSYVILSKTQLFMGSVKAAFDSLGEAEKIGKAFEEDDYLWGHFHSQAAVAYDRSDQPNKAIVAHGSAARLFQRQGLKWRAALALNNMAFLLTEQRIYDEAERWLLEAIELVNQDPHLHTKACIYDSLGHLYILMERFDDAEWLLNGSAEIFESVEDYAQLVGTLVHLSELFNRTARFKDAVDTAVTALQYARDCRNTVLIEQADKQLTVVVHSEAKRAYSKTIKRIIEDTNQ